MKLRPATITGVERPNLPFRLVHKPTDKAKLILYMMKSLGYSEAKATRMAGI